MIKIILPGTIRIKKNSKRIYARGKMKTVIPSKAYVEWEKIAREIAKIQLLECESSKIYPVSHKIHVKVLAYYKGREFDLSGALESVGDAMEGILWKNDMQIESWDGSRKFHDKENHRTEIYVYEF